MLNVLRENFKETPLLKIVLVIVGVSMVGSLGYYFAFPAAGTAGNWAIRVNGAEIPFQEFSERARNLDNRYQEMLGEAYAQFRQPERIAREAIDSLVQDELIRQDARRLGLRPSVRELADFIVNNPQFQDESGRFIGRERYLDVVGGTRGATRYERQIADALLARRWHDVIGQGVSIDDAALEQSWRAQSERTRVEFVVIPSAEQKIDDGVSDGELAGWFAEHAQDYRREESRRIRVVVVDREKFEGTIEVTDQETQDHYAANEARYRHPEQRRARHILFRLPSDADDETRQRIRSRAEEVRARVAAGESFGELARELSEDPVSAEREGDLGFFARNEMVTPFADAAFATAPGELAPVVESPFGFHVIEVTGARDEGPTPLEEVREEIRRELVGERTQQRLLAEAQRVRDAVGDDPTRLEEVARAEGLEVRSHVVEGRQRLAEIGATPQFAVAVSQLPAGSVSQPLPLAGGMAIVAVDELLPPAVPPFEEVRERVREDVLADRRTRAAVEDGRRALAAHVEFSRVAEQLGREVQDSGLLRPGQGIPGVGATGPELAEKLFGDHVLLGSRGVAEVPSGALVYEVAERQPFDALAFETGKPELRRQLLAQRRLEYGQSVLSKLREQQQVEVNPRVTQF
jgi:peptidyl-prolyl cis-trans isomerase D